jgi:tetratricopeptide (TPR) repeat protein
MVPAMAQLLFAVPASTKIESVVRACEQLNGPIAIKIEDHQSSRRKLRWFALFGEEERDPEETLSTLVAKLKVVNVAIYYNTTGFSRLRTFEQKGRGIQITFEAGGDGGEESDAIAERFSKSDQNAFLMGPADYEAKEKGWRAFGRMDGKLRENERIDDEVNVDGWALEWSDLADWEPGTNLPTDWEGPGVEFVGVTPELLRAHDEEMSILSNIDRLEEEEDWPGVLAEVSRFRVHGRTASVLRAEHFANAALGNVARALAVVDEIIELWPRDCDPDEWGLAQYNRACYLARLGRLDEAMAALEFAASQDPDHAADALSDPDLDPLKDLERFRALVPVKSD